MFDSPVIAITGTNTGVGKTIVTAALAATAIHHGRRVAVLKPAQTGVLQHEAGDVQEIQRLVEGVTVMELRRYAEPLAPATAARRSGEPAVKLSEVVDAVSTLRRDHDLVLIEGAGGLLVRFDDSGLTLADIAVATSAPVLVVTTAQLGTLNATALVREALAHRSLVCAGIVIGAWPREPDLAALCNFVDLPSYCNALLIGSLPEGMSSLKRDAFAQNALDSLTNFATRL